jgi:hypothetical protein
LLLYSSNLLLGFPTGRSFTSSTTRQQVFWHHQQVFWRRCRGLNYIFPHQLGTIKQQSGGTLTPPPTKVELKGWGSLGRLGHGQPLAGHPMGAPYVPPISPRVPPHPYPIRGAPRPTWASLLEGPNKVGYTFLIK